MPEWDMTPRRLKLILKALYQYGIKIMSRTFFGKVVKRLGELLYIAGIFGVLFTFWQKSHN